MHVPWKHGAQAPPLDTSQGKLEKQQKNTHQAPPPSTLPQPTEAATPPSLPAQQPVKVKPAKRHKHKSENTAAAEPQSAPAADVKAPSEATENPPPPASPIGKLTAGDDAASGKTKQEALNLIRQTEGSLSKIKHPLSRNEQTTAEQIRTFLAQAKQALSVGDSDGAQTLATKAKLLLDELLKG
jgi:hypothetical protein